MESGIVRLKWEVDRAGYELVDREEKRGRTILTSEPGGTYIVPRGGKPKSYDIGLRERDLFLELANTPHTPEGVLDFTNKWGLLYAIGEQPLSSFLETRQSMEWSLTHSDATVKRSFRSFDFASLKIELERRGIVLRARSLGQFCWLERFHALQGGVDIYRCAGCGTFLPVHKQGRPKKYCSNACRQAQFRKNKKTADRRS